MTSPLDSGLGTFDKNVDRIIKILGRVILMPFYATIVVYIFVLFWDFGRMALNLITEEQAMHSTMKMLGMIDATMIANFAWLVAIGSYYYFASATPSESDAAKTRLRCFLHVSSGVLKEKTAGSLIGITFMPIVTYALDLAHKHEPVDWSYLGALLVVHCVLLLSLLAFNHCNRGEEHGGQHDHNSEKDPHQGAEDSHHEDKPN